VFTDEEPLGTTQRDAFRDQVKALIRGGADATTRPSSVVDAGEVDDPGSPDVCPLIFNIQTLLTTIIIALRRQQ
jgi:hypothetical protein